MSAYKELLAEVLGRVDEEINVTIKNNDKVLGVGALDPALGLDSKERQKTYPYSGDYKDAIAALADNSKPDDKITDPDFDEIPEKDKQDAINLMNLLSTSTNDSIKQAADDASAELTAAPDELTSDYESATVQKAKPAVDAFAQGSLTDVESSATFDDASTDLTKISNFQVAAPQSMIDRFAQIKGTDGKTGLLAKFNELMQFGVALDAGKTGVEDWLRNKQNTEGISAAQAQLLFMTYVPVFLLFADMSKIISGNEAGYAFEKYLALLLSAPILGGANGAVDNVNKIISTGEHVYMSAKMYTGVGFKNVSQALKKGEPDGIEGIVRVGGKDIFYISIAKLGQGSDSEFNIGKYSGSNETLSTTTNYNALAIFVTKISWAKDESSPHKGRYMIDTYDGDGKVIDTQPAQYSGSTSIKILPQSIGGRGKIELKLIKNLKSFLIPVPVFEGDGADLSTLAGLSANYVAQIADNFNSTLIGTVRSIYEKLQGTEESTKSYVAIRSRDDADSNPDRNTRAISYVDSVGKEYSELLVHFRELFNQIGDLTKSSDATQNTFKESKDIDIEGIKKLTEEIFKEMLRGDE